MEVMTRWDAFPDLRAVQDQANHYVTRLLAQIRGQEPGPGTRWVPAVDISEREDAYVIAVELPGVKLDDLEIAYQDGLLTVQGERGSAPGSAGEQTHVVERRHGSFRRSITLPPHVTADAIEASFEDGVLRVLLPKAGEVRPTRIEVHAVPATTNVPR